MINPFKNKKGLAEVFNFIRDVGGLEESDYKDLITRLNEIKSTIALLEKTIFK